MLIPVIVVLSALAAGPAERQPSAEVVARAEQVVGQFGLRGRPLRFNTSELDDLAYFFVAIDDEVDPVFCSTPSFAF